MRAVSLVEAALKTVFGSVGKNIILIFVNQIGCLFFFYYIQLREKDISHDENWGEWVEVWGLELYRPGIFIYIYLYFRNSLVAPKQRRGACSL